MQPFLFFYYGCLICYSGLFVNLLCTIPRRERERGASV